MELLKNEAVKNLISRAAAAGNKKPTVAQLKTLAFATGNVEAHKFLRLASVKDLTAVKNCIAIVNGEEPKATSKNEGTVFGLTGEKETKISGEKSEKLFAPEIPPKTTEEQKDINERKAIPQEEKHPETSDRATIKPAVSEPLKEKTDPEFKKILERGEDHLKEIEKETAKIAGVNKTAATTFPEGDWHTGKKTNPDELTAIGICSAAACIYNMPGELTCSRIQIEIHADGSCLYYEPKQTTASKSDHIATHAKRISRGESVINVLKDFASKFVGKQAVINPGDNITINNPTAGPTNVTFEAGNMAPDGTEQLVGKDSSGNVQMVVPKGMDPMQIKDANG
jgi:hypothetical protein